MRLVRPLLSVKFAKATYNLLPQTPYKPYSWWSWRWPFICINVCVCNYAHPPFKASWTGARKTRLGNYDFCPRLAETKRKKIILDQTHSRICLGSSRFWLHKYGQIWSCGSPGFLYKYIPEEVIRSGGCQSFMLSTLFAISRNIWRCTLSKPTKKWTLQMRR